jgi:DNA-binding IclR family transcriptional regulator
MAKRWTGLELLDVARSFQVACLLTTGAVLDVFSPLHAKTMTAAALARKLGTDRRATTFLLDALAALGLLIKRDDSYSVPEDVAKLLTEQSRENILPMVRHLANSLRRWAELARVVQTGRPAQRTRPTHQRRPH